MNPGLGIQGIANAAYAAFVTNQAVCRMSSRHRVGSLGRKPDTVQSPPRLQSRIVHYG